MLLVALGDVRCFFYVSLYVQQILGFSPVEAGASFLPADDPDRGARTEVGRLVDRIGSRWLTGGGMTLLALSLLVFSRLGTGSSYGTSSGPRVDGLRHGADDDPDDRRRHELRVPATRQASAPPS